MAETVTTPVLTVVGLEVGYQGARILRGVNVTLQAGDILGLVGANGAGKSSMLRALTGQIPLWAGRVEIAGIDLASHPERAKAGFGYAVDPADLPNPLTGRQYLEMVASVKGCDAAAWPAGDMADILSFRAWLDRPIAGWSFGTRMKLTISAALLGSPPLLILDESLNGLDPIITWRLKQLLIELAASQRFAIVLSSHQLDMVAAVASRAMLLADGTVQRQWSNSELVAARKREGGFERDVIEALNERAEQGLEYSGLHQTISP